MRDEALAEPVSACCGPARAEGEGVAIIAEPVLASVETRVDGSTKGMVLLPGGSFLMGATDSEGFAADGEAPVRAVTLRPFWIDTAAVTNARFAAFVAATGYTTDAERFGWSFVFSGLLPDDFPQTRGVAAAPWWRQVMGACWRQPEGTDSSWEGRAEHPAVHLSWRDAVAFCKWEGTRLPTEAEWEYAARGGLEQARYPWGNALTPGGHQMCNIWQGTFPSQNTLDDGFLGTAPVTAFAPNGFGLSNTSGNVWEWCRDWFSPTFHANGPRKNPAGPRTGQARVIRGGSYLCHRSYCNRYRVAARSSNTPDSSTGHAGFRCARDA